MHGLGAGLLAGFNDLVDQQIGLGGGRRPDVNRLIRHFDMQRVSVSVGIDGDGRDTHAAAVLMMRQAISPRLAISICEHGRPNLKAFDAPASAPRKLAAPVFILFFYLLPLLRPAASTGRCRRCRSPCLIRRHE